MARLRGETDLRFDRILARNLLLQHNLHESNIFVALQTILRENGRICLIQTIPKHGQRLYDLVDWSKEKDALFTKVKKAEDGIYEDVSDPLVNWDEKDLETAVASANLTITQQQLETEISQKRITATQLDRWFSVEEPYGERLSYGRRLRQAGLTEKEVERVAKLYGQQLREQTINWHTKVLYNTAVCSS